MRRSDEENLFQALLRLTQCRGAEDPPGDQDDDSDDDDGDDGDAGTGDDGKKKEGDGDKKDDDDGDAADNLKKALRAERKQRKQFERELKQLRQLQTDKKEGDDGEAAKLQKKADSAEAKATRLAERLLKTAVDGAIVKAATKLNFRDVDDALAQVKRDLEAWVDQDEDDPSEIEVDAEAVERAVKKLAESKKYLLKVDGEMDPSGSKFGGRGNNNDALSEEKLRQKYSALGPGATTST